MRDARDGERRIGQVFAHAFHHDGGSGRAAHGKAHGKTADIFKFRKTAGIIHIYPKKVPGIQPRFVHVARNKADIHVTARVRLQDLRLYGKIFGERDALFHCRLDYGFIRFERAAQFYAVGGDIDAREFAVDVGTRAAQDIRARDADRIRSRLRKRGRCRKARAKAPDERQKQ